MKYPGQKKLKVLMSLLLYVMQVLLNLPALKVKLSEFSQDTHI